MPALKGMDKECEWCGNTFYVQPRRLQISKFCSVTCKNKASEVKTSWTHVPCHTCGKIVERRTTKLMKHTYCNRECRDNRPYTPKAVRKDKGVTRSEYVSAPCLTCGTIVERRKTDTRQYVYCSRNCYRTNPFAASPGRPGDPNRQQYETPWGLRPGYTSKDGYVVVSAKEHPAANKNGKIAEHKLVMEKKLGRYLEPNENVHHKNGIRNDNSIDNLELWNVSQPRGQRVDDKTEWAIQHLKRYAPELLQ